MTRANRLGVSTVLKQPVAILTMLMLVAMGRSARAQDVAVEIVPFIGSFDVDDDALPDFAPVDGITIKIDSGAIYGARFRLPIGRALGVGASYGYAPVDVMISGGVLPPERRDGSVQTFYGQADFRVLEIGPVRVNAVFGAGWLRLDSDGSPRGFEDGSTDRMTLLGGDAVLAITDRLAVGVTVREHRQSCDTPEDDSELSFCSLTEDETLRHHETAGQVSLRF